jgi:8-oxo-dGTP diphosphatase
MSQARRLARPAVTVDVVTVTLEREDPRVLLIKRKKAPYEGSWAIPGGFVEPNEPLETAARRELREETGATPTHLKQLHTFGDPGRDPRGWTISVAYLALLAPEAMVGWHLRAASDASELDWFPLLDPPPLAFDHALILSHAASYLADRGIIGQPGSGQDR